MAIPEQYARAVAKFPRLLQDLVEAELAAGNSIAEIGSGFPAPFRVACLMLAKPITTRPRASDEHIDFLQRNNSTCAAQITDADKCFYILEPPLPQPPEPYMDAIRAELEARERASNAELRDR